MQRPHAQAHEPTRLLPHTPSSATGLVSVAEVPGDSTQLPRGEQATATATVAELVAWADSRWAPVSQQWAARACRRRWSAGGCCSDWCSDWSWSARGYGGGRAAAPRSAPLPSPSATTEAAATHATPTTVDQMAMPNTLAAATLVRRGTLVKSGRTVPYR